MFASLVLGTRYRPSWVWAGVAAAFTVHMGIAVTAGQLLALLPDRVVEAVVAGAVRRRIGLPVGDQPARPEHARG